MSIKHCSKCGQYFDSIREALDHDCTTTQPGEDTRQPIPDGGRTLELDGEHRQRVKFTSGGVQFSSEPLDPQRAQAYANALADAIVRVDSGERPLCDDERAVIEPVEVDDE